MISSRALVLQFHPRAFAARFGNSKKWYICSELGGHILGLGPTKSAAWRHAASSMGCREPQLAAGLRFAAAMLCLFVLIAIPAVVSAATRWPARL